MLPTVPDEGLVIPTVSAWTGNGETKSSDVATANTKTIGSATLDKLLL